MKLHIENLFGLCFQQKKFCNIYTEISYWSNRPPLVISVHETGSYSTVDYD